VCPLTGEEPRRGVDPSRPAVAVKIENSPQARPQSGLESADVVYEEVVEGGITRFMAIYHCGTHEQIGPVRSARFDDPKLALPFTSLVAASGSNDIVRRELRQQGVVLIENEPEGKEPELYRVPAGVRDIHNLFTDADALFERAVSEGVEPPTPDVFEFGHHEGRGRRVGSLRINFLPTSTIEFRWEKRSWQRYEAGVPFMTKAGDQIGVPNVVVHEVRVDNSKRIFDVAGNPSPDITLIGSGRALLFRNGRMIRGRWSMEEGEAPVYTTRGGDPLVFEKGPIWIELVPSAAGDVKGTFSFE
jgi:hypothetical protein